MQNWYYKIENTKDFILKHHQIEKKNCKSVPKNILLSLDFFFKSLITCLHNFGTGPKKSLLPVVYTIRYRLTDCNVTCEPWSRCRLICKYNMVPNLQNTMTHVLSEIIVYCPKRKILHTVGVTKTYFLYDWESYEF